MSRRWIVTPRGSDLAVIIIAIAFTILSAFCVGRWISDELDARSDAKEQMLRDSRGASIVDQWGAK